MFVLIVFRSIYDYSSVFILLLILLFILSVSLALHNSPYHPHSL